MTTKRFLIASCCGITVALSSASLRGATGGPPPTAHALIAHAGDDRTTEGSGTVTLDASTSWDAQGHALTCSWTQTEGPGVTLTLTDPCRPSFTAPVPGAGGIAAENQVLVFQVSVSDGTSTSSAQTRVLVLKPFDPVADGPAIVTNTLVGGGGVYPPGSLGFALQYADSHPGTRVTFDLPATDSGYHPLEGTWQFPHAGAGSIPMLRFVRGVTIDGFSQHVNARRRGEVVNSIGPAIVIPGVILEFGHYFAGAGTAERTIARGLIQEMFVWSA